MGKLWKASAAVLLALAALPSFARAQATGTITGTVTAAESGGPLSGAQVSLQGTVRRTVTDAQGRYRLTAEPGTYTVQVSTLGRQAGSRQVTVTAGGTATANFSLGTSAVALEGITVNAVTGEAERHREVGTAVSSIPVGEINKAAAPSLANVLTARAPGVTLQGVAGTTGTSSRIRIRGANSLSLSNEPLIFVDGVQASNNKGGFGVGGQSPNRLNDINPEDIQNIEVLKGPAASAIYGTAAANGVLLITTKRGRAGTTVWRTYGEAGNVKDMTNYPPNYLSVQTVTPGEALYDTVYGYGYSNTTDVFGGGAPYITCVNYNAATAACKQDITVSFSPLDDPRTTPFSTGRRGKAGLNVSGGGQGLSFYVSGDIEGERGVLNYNRLERTSFRGNFNADPSPKLSLQLNTSYIGSRLDQVQGDNNIFSPIINGLLGPAQYVPGMESDTIGTPGGRVASYFGYNPQDDANLPTSQGVDRMILGANANYRPLQWLTVNGNAGIDFFARADAQTVDPASNIPLSTEYILGYRDAQKSNNWQWTTNLSSIARFDLSSNVVSTTTLGTSYQRSLFNQVFCEGVGIPSGTSSCGATTSLFSVDESQTDNRTLGGYVRQEFAFSDRLFLAASVRGDKNSGLVTGFIYYPSASLSWVVSEEPFFPQLSFLSNLRLRGAIGTSGQRPEFGQAETLFSAVSAQRNATEQAAVVLNNTGNENLKPERTRELEFGADLGLLQDRLSVDFTAFTKKSRDALISRNLEPSAGLTASVFQNLGEIKNSGTELGINALVVDRRNLRFNARLAASTLNNKIIEMGEGIAPISLNRGVQFHREGFSAGGFFARPYKFNDANNNGLLDRGEIRVDSSRFITVRDQVTGRDTTLALEYIGPALPTNTQALSADLTLFRNITFTTVFERRAGNHQMNYTEYFRCVSGTVGLGLCNELANPGASLEEQARYLAAANLSTNPGLGSSLWGFIEDASFVKWREFSVRLGAPESWGQRFPLIRGAAFTVAGRNLKTWTDYSGLDPETNEGGGASNFNQGEFNTQPPVRYWTARIDLTF
ncbi:MAG: SusC/RagA family TonB-linked outer membrane protein [Longimicrobiaceae bacterium]